MILATLLFSINIFSTALASPGVTANHLFAPQSTPAGAPADTSPTQNQATAPAAQNQSTPTQPPASTTTPVTAAAPKKAPSHPSASKKHHRKKVASSHCAPASGEQPNSSTGSASVNCPPAKVIVRQGGTSEPSVQLAGGTTAPRGDTANQMLATTEANLKKITGQQLDSSQQDMVNQIHQFMEQSKAAVTDGDLERARTLAWKAQLLSDELVKPPK
jgi:hypothetical protein